MRNAISRRRPLNLTRSRFATLLQAISKTKRRLQEGGEGRTQIPTNVFRQILDRGESVTVDLVGILRE